MKIFGSIVTTSYEENFLEAIVANVKLGLSLQPNHCATIKYALGARSV